MPRYPGILVYQRASTEALPIFVLAAPAKEILSWSDVLQTARTPGAAQRLENAAHIDSIRAYIRAAPLNIIPTSITLALEAGTYSIVGGPEPRSDHPQVCTAELDITVQNVEDKPGFVIDGQHRLKAIAEADEAVPVVAAVILGASRLERALHFVVINNKAKRVSGDLVRGIVAELPEDDQTALRRRLVAVGLTLGNYPSALEVLGANATSPFCDLIDWDINRSGTRRIKPQALEGAIRVVLSGVRPPDKLDFDDAVELLAAMWRGVVEAWGETEPTWYSENSKLAGKASIVAVTEFLVERVNMKIEEGLDVGSLSDVQNFCKDVMKGVPPSFWTSPWNKSELDTSAGRSLIRQSLAEIRRASASRLDDPVNHAPLTSTGTNET